MVPRDSLRHRLAIGHAYVGLWAGSELAVGAARLRSELRSDHRHLDRHALDQSPLQGVCKATGLRLGVEGSRWGLYWLFGWLGVMAPFVGHPFGLFPMDLTDFSGYRASLEGMPGGEQFLALGSIQTVVRGVTDLFRPVIGLGAKPGKPALTPAEYYPKGLLTMVRPGIKWAYSNHAFNTLGQLVEDISGESFAEYMRRQVFEPLGMASTDYLLSERVREALAQGYNFSMGRLKPVDYLEITVRGAGSVFSTVEDMCRYVAALLGGGANERGRVL
jgi:hypothetical protein